MKPEYILIIQCVGLFIIMILSLADRAYKMRHGIYMPDSKYQMANGVSILFIIVITFLYFIFYYIDYGGM